MASIQRFEEIEACQTGRALTRQIYQLTSKGDFSPDFTLKDHIKRACVSITSNIAEGFERGGNREFVQFLATAKGSASEVKSQLHTALAAGRITRKKFDELDQQAHSVVSLLAGFIKYLQPSELRGRKFKPVASRNNPEP